jgi:hypothetical protein
MCWGGLCGGAIGVGVIKEAEGSVVTIRAQSVSLVTEATLGDYPGTSVHTCATQTVALAPELVLHIFRRKAFVSVGQ